MRRGSSTIVSLVGDPGPAALDALVRAPNVSLLRASGNDLAAAAAALDDASRRRLSPYVVLVADPLGEVAREWRVMWDLQQPGGQFEERAGDALAAWRSGRFELPDYYLVLTDDHREAAAPHPNDLHLGVLRGHRPARVVPVVAAADDEAAAAILQALGSLRQAPWWPPLDALIDDARAFFPGRLAG